MPHLSSKLDELIEAQKVFLSWGSFQSQLEQTPYEMSKIIQLLGFPFERMISIDQKIRSIHNEAAKNIYEEASSLMQLTHAVIQQCFQQQSDQVRVRMGHKTHYEEIKGLGIDKSFIDYLTSAINREKSMFWLPSRQRQQEIYLEKIQFLEKELAEAHETLFPQEKHEAVSTSSVQSPYPPVEKEERPEEKSPNLSVQQADASLVEQKADQEKDRIDEKFSLHEQQKFKEDKDIEIPDIVEEAIFDEEHHAIQAQLNEQYKKDRQRKKDRKKLSFAAAAAENLETLNGKENFKDFKDHPTLKRIFTLDITLKYEAFLDFFKELSLHIGERKGGICVWFNQELCKIFHRPHTRGNVVPFIDLKVAKTSLKKINIVPRFKYLN
ncbi:MAG: hypothetical protein JSS34_02940 [Proteobacteria bacterium]|nr:hypothetical protein [Pseudomonadota bacterium]